MNFNFLLMPVLMTAERLYHPVLNSKALMYLPLTPPVVALAVTTTLLVLFTMRTAR